jgi:hypothetical protein
MSPQRPSIQPIDQGSPEKQPSDESCRLPPSCDERAHLSSMRGRSPRSRFRREAAGRENELPARREPRTRIPRPAWSPGQLRARPAPTTSPDSSPVAERVRPPDWFPLDQHRLVRSSTAYDPHSTANRRQHDEQVLEVTQPSRPMSATVSRSSTSSAQVASILAWL